MVGYRHPDYAGSLKEWGTPYELPHCGGWIIKRSIPGSDFHDAMGCYPLFLCRNWDGLLSDVESLGDELVSLSLVTDPFGTYTEEYLRECFPDVMYRFKEHYITELQRPMESFVSDHHRRYSQKALQDVYVEKYEDPHQYLHDWTSLYDNLIRRHGIEGIARFSPAAFDRQLKIPGMVAFRAEVEKSVVGMNLWYVHDRIGYYHLGAYSDLGYEVRASFALFRTAIEYFMASGLEKLGLGAGAGLEESPSDGLGRFKDGWATGRVPVYFCGRILNTVKYTEIINAGGITNDHYFPAYRKGECG